MLKFVVAASMAAVFATSANAADYIKYEILTNGSGNITDARSGTNSVVRNLGFTFVAVASGGTSMPLPAGNGTSFMSSVFNLGLLPGSATASYVGSVLSLTDTSSDHTFTADACSPKSLAGLPTSGFGTASACSNALTFNANFSRGAQWTYSGQTVEIRASAFSGEGIPAGLTILSAVPEPATWAMIMLGFGMVAGVARYCRRSAAVNFI